MLSRVGCSRWYAYFLARQFDVRSLLKARPTGCAEEGAREGDSILFISIISPPALCGRGLGRKGRHPPGAWAIARALA